MKSVVWTPELFYVVALLGVVHSFIESLCRLLFLQLEVFFAVSLRDTSDIITLLICVYLPTDYGTLASYNDFLFALGELEGFITS